MESEGHQTCCPIFQAFVVSQEKLKQTEENLKWECEKNGIVERQRQEVQSYLNESNSRLQLSEAQLKVLVEVNRVLQNELNHLKAKELSNEKMFESVQDIRRYCSETLSTKNDVAQIKSYTSEILSAVKSVPEELQKDSVWHRFFPSSKSPKQCGNCAIQNQEIQRLKEMLQTQSQRVNEELQCLQGDSFSRGDAKRVVNGYFDQAFDEQYNYDIESLTNAKQQLCSNFMNVSNFVQTKILVEIRNCFKDLFQPEKGSQNTDVLRAFSILFRTIDTSSINADFTLHQDSLFKQLKYATRLPHRDLANESLKLCLKLLAHVPPYVPRCEFPAYNERYHLFSSELKEGDQIGYLQPVLLDGEIIISQGRVCQLKQDDQH